jgi:hypothetical protein
MYRDAFEVIGFDKANYILLVMRSAVPDAKLHGILQKWGTGS